MRRKNHRNNAFFKIPNQFILDVALSYSEKRVGCVIYSRCNCLGACQLSMKQIAGLACCTTTTALRAVHELEHSGYVTRKKKLSYSQEHGRAVYQKSKYSVSSFNRFTFVPHNVFRFAIRNSSLTVYLSLRMCAGNAKRAFPSLNRICDALEASKSTVCMALDELSNVGLVRSENCIKKNGAYSKNSYFFICNAVPSKRQRPVIFHLKKAQHTRRMKKCQLGVKCICHKLFYVSIIRVKEVKINTGG